MLLTCRNFFEMASLFLWPVLAIRTNQDLSILLPFFDTNRLRHTKTLLLSNFLTVYLFTGLVTSSTVGIIQISRGVIPGLAFDVDLYPPWRYTSNTDLLTCPIMLSSRHFSLCLSFGTARILIFKDTFTVMRLRAVVLNMHILYIIINRCLI